MFNVRLAGGHLYGKQLFTWLSLVVSLMASFVLSFFPLDVLDEIWDLIESVSEGFLPTLPIFRDCLGWGYISLYKFWEGAQIYLSGKGPLLVSKGVVKLPRRRSLVESLSKQYLPFRVSSSLQILYLV